MWKLKDYLRRFGPWRAFCRLAFRVQYPCLGYTRYLCLTLGADARAVSQSVPGGFISREVDLSELEPLLSTPESNVRRKDLDRAREEGHRCVGIFEGGRLASFSLNTPVPTGLDATWVFEFPDGWVYHYMAVTLPPWRGRRLHAMQIPAIRGLFSGRRFHGIVTLVATENDISRASFARMGFETVRRFTVLGRPDRQILLTGRTRGPFSLVRHSRQE